MSAFFMPIAGLLIRLFDNQSVRFIFTGGIVACLYFGLIYVLLTIGIKSWLSALIAYLVAFSIGYISHKFFTFKSKSNHSVSLPRYVALQFSCAAFASISASGAERFGLMQPLLISLLSTVVLGAVSYLVSSKWVFSNDKSSK